MAGRAQGQGLTGPAVEAVDGLPRRQVEGQGQLRGRARQHLEADLQQDAQGTLGPDHEARQVVAGDVFHHLAPKAQHLAAAIDDPDPQDEIPGGAGIGPGGAREAAGNGPAQGSARVSARAASGSGSGSSVKMGGLEGQPLTALGQGGLDLGQGRAGPGGDHQFGRLVAEDAAMAGDRQRLPRHGSPQPGLAGAALDTQRPARVMGRRDLARQILGKVLVHRSLPPRLLAPRKQRPALALSLITHPRLYQGPPGPNLKIRATAKPASGGGQGAPPRRKPLKTIRSRTAHPSSLKTVAARGI